MVPMANLYDKMSSQDTRSNCKKIQQKSRTINNLPNLILGFKHLPNYPSSVEQKVAFVVFPIRLGKGQISQDFLTRFWDN
jgi:hypothetical protein